jgi:hypothetical protein
MEVCNVRKRYLVAAAMMIVAALAIGAVVAGAGDERDKVAPTASVDAAPQYWNGVAISASAADAAGVAYIYYEFDGAVMRVAKVDGVPTQAVVPLQVTPADITIPSPDPSATPQPHEVNDPSAPGSHTLTYWAQDALGNVGPRQTVTYKAGTDTESPVTATTGATDGAWFNRRVQVVLESADTGASGVAALVYSVDGGTPITVPGAAPQAVVTLKLNAESHVVEYGATDLAGNVEARKSLTVHFENVAPSVKTWNASVRKGANAKLKFRVSDAAPNGGTASVVIKIVKYGRGGVVKKFERNVRVNELQTVKFRCKLARGEYAFTVVASDAAGNDAVPTSASIGELRVR